MIPLLLPLIAQLAPPLVDWLFGPKAGATTQAVVSAVQSVTGADPSTAEGVAAAQAILQGKPELAAQLQAQLMAIKVQMQAEANREADEQRKADLAEMQAAIADVANARQQTIDLAKTGSPIAWAPVIVSTLVMSTFLAVTGLALTHQLPAGSETLLSLLIGTLTSLATAVVQYWLGSSAGSARKDATLAKALTAANAGA